ncbi:MAG: hypothetical protein NVSMB9_05260 [Isosphaeraceae bacterium]
MSTCNSEIVLQSLELPGEFEDLSGLLQTDIRAVVSVLTERASQRLLLTRRESRHLRQTLWNRLTEAVNDSLEPLSAERR